MRMRPFFTRQWPLVLEHGDIFEPWIALQVGDAQGIGSQHALDLLIAHRCELQVVLPSLHNDLVCAHRAHAVVDSIRLTPGLALDAVERIDVRKDAHLPGALRRQHEQSGRLILMARAERTPAGCGGRLVRMAHDHPTACDWVLTEFHLERAPKLGASKTRSYTPAGSTLQAQRSAGRYNRERAGQGLSGVPRRSGSYFQPVAVPDGPLAAVTCHFEVLRQLQAISRASVF